MTQIDPNDIDEYIPYIAGMYSQNSVKNVSTCKYFCRVPQDDGWDKVMYFYDKK